MVTSKYTKIHFLSINYDKNQLCQRSSLIYTLSRNKTLVPKALGQERFKSDMKLMPRLHLLRSSHDLFVYDFFGIVGGYTLRRICLHCLRSPYDFFRQQTRTKPYRDLADIVRQPLSYNHLVNFTNRMMPVR